MAVALFAISTAGGLILTVALGNRTPLLCGVLVGLYLLFSIKIADQWEKVAVLRMGRYIGLRGPGIFHVVPVVDRLSRRRSASARRERHSGIDADT
jgi:regulator of protease activity HflC (stomatin/prohibitin superfamily)